MSTRIPEYPIEQIFLDRWSPRALSPEPITQAQLMSLFEAAKWAASSFNNQPWRFIYTEHKSHQFNTLLSTMNAYNHAWAQQASVLVLVLSYRFFEKNKQPSSSHSFDTGAACQNLALQASLEHIACHIIEGFDKEATRTHIKIPNDYAIEVLIALGKPRDPSALPEQLQSREKPSDRKKLHEIVFKDVFSE